MVVTVNISSRFISGNAPDKKARVKLALISERPDAMKPYTYCLEIEDHGRQTLVCLDKDGARELALALVDALGGT